MLVLGDMNDDTGSPTYEVFGDSLQDACDVKGGGLAKTWNSAVPITRIDYVWASKAFEIDGCNTLDSAASDHLPVLVTIRAAPWASGSSARARGNPFVPPVGPGGSGSSGSNAR